MNRRKLQPLGFNALFATVVATLVISRRRKGNTTKDTETTELLAAEIERRVVQCTGGQSVLRWEHHLVVMQIFAVMTADRQGYMIVPNLFSVIFVSSVVTLLAHL